MIPSYWGHRPRAENTSAGTCRPTDAVADAWASATTPRGSKEGARRAVNPAGDFQTRRAPLSLQPTRAAARGELERETGPSAPSTKKAVDFSYRLGEMQRAAAARSTIA